MSWDVVETAVKDSVFENIKDGEFDDVISDRISLHLEKEDYGEVRDAIKYVLEEDSLTERLLKTEEFLEGVKTAFIKSLDKNILLAALTDQDKLGVIQKILEHNMDKINKVVNDKINEGVSKGVAEMCDALELAAAVKLEKVLEEKVQHHVNKKVASLSLWQRVFGV